ncbi:MAG: RNA polymerase sigma factor [Dysgonomonas sp.]
MNESELWTIFREGDESAFTSLYKLSYKKLYSYGLNLGMEDEQIRDIIQDLFIKLYTKPELIKEADTIKPFLFVSMRNAFINQKRVKNKYLSIEQIDNFDLRYSIHEDSIEKEEERKSIEDRINNIISGLTPRQKEIIYLRFLHQMSYEEIADIMNMSEQSARNLVYRTIDGIKKRSNGYKLVFLILVNTLY